MSHILITGGCGFVGSNLAIDLTRRGYDVTVFDNFSRSGSEFLRKTVEQHGVKVVRGDVRHSEELESLTGEYSLLIESSAEPSVMVGTRGEEAKYVLDVNLVGAINCFEWARKRKTPVIFISSSRVYPYDRLNACQYEERETRFELVKGCDGVDLDGVQVNMPLQGARSLYGASKLSAEFILQEYATQYDLPAIIDRCGVISGPGQLGKIDQGVFAFWLISHFFKKPLSYIGFGGQGKQVRDLLHIHDLAVLIAKQVQCLLEDKPAYRGEVFLAGGSTVSNLSLQETTKICEELTGNHLDIGSVLSARSVDMIWYLTNNRLTEKEFNWRPELSGRIVLEDIFKWLENIQGDPDSRSFLR